MAQQVVMPKQGNTVESCIIDEWKKKVGDTVAEGDVICTAETDKSTIDVESTAAGTILALLYNEGDDVPVQVPIAVVGQPGEKVEAAPAAEAAPAPAAAPAAAPAEAAPAAPAALDPDLHLVVMPKQGNTVESCIIDEWKKKVGDTVAEGDVLCTAETDKSTIDVECTAAGTLLAVLYEEGDDVPVQLPIAVVGPAGKTVDAAAIKGGKPASEAAPAAAAQAETAAPVAAVAAVAATGASPRARNMANALGIALNTLNATGPKGMIIERDVLAAAGEPLSAAARAEALEKGIAAPKTGSGIGGRVLLSDLQAPAAPAAVKAEAPKAEVKAEAADEFTDVPVKGVRKVTARRMMESMHGTCQLTLNKKVNATAMQKLRAGFKASREELGLNKITINDLVMFAVSRTLVDFPDFNAHFLGDKIRKFNTVHLGMATDTPRGLLVPVIRNAETLSLKQMSAEAKRLAGKCHEGTAAPDEITGSTITVTNVGAFGIESFTPVINVPEVAIVGVGGIAPQPVIAKDGTVSFVPQMTISLTIDHQAVDGAPAARFLKTLCDNIESIDLLLAI